MGGVVLQADFDAVLGELVGVSSGDNNVAGHPGVGHLTDNVAVGGANNKSVLWSVEFVFVLSAETLAGLVIGFSCLTASEFRLEAFEVGLVLLDLDEFVDSLFSHITLVFTGHDRTVGCVSGVVLQKSVSST